MKDAMGRRLRYMRATRKPVIEMGERDLEVLSLLARYRYLRKDFLVRLLGDVSEQWVTRRLRSLFDLGLINRPQEQWQAYNARYSPVVYEIDDRGEEVLRQHGLYPMEVSHLTRKARNGAIRQYPHSMMICDTLASIEIGLQGSGCSLVTWQQIIERRGTMHLENPFKLPCKISYTFPATGKTHHANTYVIPDGLFGIRYPDKGVRFFAIEAERGNGIRRSNLEQPSFLKKVLAYKDIITQKTHTEVFGIPNLRVLVVTPKAERARHMAELAVETIGPSNIFLFHDIPTQDSLFKAPKPFPELFTEPWNRAGREPVYINENTP